MAGFNTFEALRLTSELDLNAKTFTLTSDLMNMQMFGQLIGFCHQLGLDPTPDNLLIVKDMYLDFKKQEKQHKAKSSGSTPV